MRFQTTPSFDSDYQRLDADEKRLFREAVRKFNRACDRWVASSGSAKWPAALRVRSVEGAPGILEMRWSFSGPDGRATWQWATITDDDGRHPAVLWRRVGGHAIFRDP